MLVGCDKAQSGPSAELRAQQNTAFQAMLKDPGNLETVMAYAQAATKAGDYEAAVSAYEGMLIINSNLPRVRLELGILYYRLKSYETSRTYLETALAVADPPSGHPQTGRAAAGEDAQAIQVIPAHLTW